MTIANRAMKAKAKASPDRLQETVFNNNVIKNKEIQSNSYIHINEYDKILLNKFPDSNISVPFAFWLENTSLCAKHPFDVAVQIAADESVDALQPYLKEIKTIILPFVNFVDGRAYSQSYILRKQLYFKGEIRAIGDVNYDQIFFLARVGIDAFELNDKENLERSLLAFNEFSELYQPSADTNKLIFSTRRQTH